MKALSYVSAILVAIAMSVVMPAFAAKCKDVKFKIKNDKQQEIKILTVKYWDSEKEKWRSERLGTWKIAPKTTESKTRNLEYVKNQRVKIKLEWKYNTGGSQWSSKKTTSAQVIPKCSGGQTVSFTVR